MGDFDRDSMLEMFTFEMNQLLEQLEQTIIEGENGYSMDRINEIFRIMHTIKGSAAMMLFTSISTTAHSIEDLFFYLREENPTGIDYSRLTDYVLEGMDFIKEELAKIEAGESADGDPAEIIMHIKGFLAFIKGEKTAEPTPAPAPVPATIPAPAAAPASAPATAADAAAKAPSQSANSYKAHITFVEGCEMENIRAFTLMNNLAQTITEVVTNPPDVINETATDYIRKNGFRMQFSTEKDYDEMHKLLMQTVYLKNLTLEANEAAAADAHAPSAVNGRHFIAVLQFEDGSEMENVRAFGVVHKLKPMVESVEHVPEDLVDEASTAVIRKDGFYMRIVTEMTYDELNNTLSETLYLKDMTLEEHGALRARKEEKPASSVAPSALSQAPASLVKPNASAEAPAQQMLKPSPAAAPGPVPVGPAKDDKAAQEPAASGKPVKTGGPTLISVNVNRLDALLKLVGELVIAEAMVTQNPELESLELESFYKEVRQLRKIIKDLQDTIMSMRLVALSTTFFKMNRIVRDMCKQLDKEVHLEIIGEETEVDKNIIEHISDPLMHIIRNSIDHGIEMPARRMEVGKRRSGKVVLEAKTAGSDVLVIVRDDGAGLNKERILAKARSNGLLRKPENEYTDKEIYQFIFMPGFSTNEKVTSFSGRGVGMDVVSKNLEVIGGSVIVESTPGYGSSFTLKIPMTLAIIEGMIVKIGTGKYTLPIMSIRDSFRPSMDDVFKDPNGNEMITVRGDCYNIVRLYEQFDIEGSVMNLEDGIMMIVENGDESICMFVDELVGEQQVVVKSMPKYIKKVRGVSGCTLLGNGDISLIIDVAGFFDK